MVPRASDALGRPEWADIVRMEDVEKRMRVESFMVMETTRATADLILKMRLNIGVVGWLLKILGREPTIYVGRSP